MSYGDTQVTRLGNPRTHQWKTVENRGHTLETRGHNPESSAVTAKAGTVRQRAGAGQTSLTGDAGIAAFTGTIGTL